MKKNIHFLIMCIVAIAFGFCVLMFNLISLSRMVFYYRAYDGTGHERTAFSIPVTDSLAEVDIADFLESVNKISAENNLFIFKANLENSDVDSFSIYLTDNDLYIKN